VPDSVPDSVPAALRIHQFAGLAPGPRLIVLGAVHGNEECGTRAIERVAAEVDGGALRVERGQLTLVPVTNPLAYRLGRRMGDRNLNRNLVPKAAPADFEDRIANVLCPLLAAHDVLLDLHSFQAPGQPFVMLGPEDNTGSLEPFAHAGDEARLVAHLGPGRVVEGWMSAYARGVARRQGNPQGYAPGLLDARYGIGTAEYMRLCGGYGVTVECGRHDDPRAPQVAYRAIRQALALLRIAPLAPEPASADFEILKLADVIDREHADDRFVQPWSSFDRVAAGQPIAVRRGGAAVIAPEDGYIVFPNANAAAGNEWFYLARTSARRLAAPG